MHRNALIYKRKIFYYDGRSPTIEPSNFFAFDFKRKFARFKFCAASTTIAIDRSIQWHRSPAPPCSQQAGERPSLHIDRDVRAVMIAFRRVVTGGRAAKSWPQGSSKA